MIRKRLLTSHHADKFINLSGLFQGSLLKSSLWSLLDRSVSPFVAQLHIHVHKCIRDPFSLLFSHPFRALHNPGVTYYYVPIADPEIRAEWQTIGRTRGRRFASTHNGRHYQCNDLSSPSQFPDKFDVSWLEDHCLKMPALLFLPTSCYLNSGKIISELHAFMNHNNIMTIIIYTYIN